MNTLTTLDAGFLQAEDSDPHVSLAIGGLAILEGPLPDPAAQLATLAERIRACPRFMQRLRRWPFDLRAPEWVDDPDFNLDNHVRRIAVPAPGRDRELYDLVAQVMSWRLDRSGPLWEIWVIEGLRDNRWAMLMKVHHCIADGIATVHMLTGLSDGGVRDSFAGRRRAAEETSMAGLRTPADITALAWLGGMWGASGALTTAALRTVRGTAELATGLLRPSPSSLNGPLSGLRRYGAARVALDDVRQVCQAFDVTINDVALAALTESYRALLVRRGEQPAPDSLRTLVPVSLRAADAFDQTDNRVSLMLPFLPVDEANPVERLRQVHARLTRTKSTGQRQAGSALTALADRVPFPLTAWTVRLLARLPQRGVAAVATNVPGPREPLQIMGRKVIGVLPVPPIAMQLRTGVAMLSYADHLYFGILADFDAVPELDEFARGVEDAVARLVAGSKRPRAARDHRGLSLVVSG
ncbi:WS/DGAT/MGAT family O-acyltransferase [[Mycobacterium] burgundiense]|uniref:Diacylglycerol O-acyltransferase n=1 Tax=[Mycobacterium] burgundiense TaxID=3064286 RepID=A0ABN9MXB3_9MYCO|nr:wax ester/triacylglycerol synthase family O-acyltransferase [Mycolicibacterium sp. MU0053]CAJ1495038.1 wax ester/triacylglycerol synthase family O-acyltransferase [Mycolicibacterium sp. MU0053]